MHNHLKGLRSYLVGPIESVTDEVATEWRNDATVYLKKMGVEVFDPTRKNMMGELNEVGKERVFIDNLKKNHDWDTFHKRFKQIVHVDLRCVDFSDFIVAYVPNDVQMVGTIHEIVEARRQKKKVFIFTHGPVEKTNSWMLWLVKPENIFRNLEDIMEHLEAQTPQSLTYNIKG